MFVGMEWPLVGRESALKHALELVSSGTGVAILGPAGVGKSRLLAELLKEAENTGMSVVRAVASESTRSIPFAPFIELLPTGPTPDRLAMLAAARHALEKLDGRRGRLISIDDAHHLDPVSLSFLTLVVGSGIANIVLASRTGQPMDAGLVGLWTNGAIERMDLGPLDRDESQSLIESVLDGSTTAHLESELWSLARGNPLVLHEILEGAVGVSVVRTPHGTWDLGGSPAKSPRLSDLVASRLRAIPETLQPAMDLVAVGAPLPYAIAQQALGDTLAELESRRLVMMIGSGGEQTVVPAHPLYGEILKEYIGSSRIQSACRTLIAAAEATGSISDPVRVALWQREARQTFSIDIALAGARAALIRHDPALCQELLAPLDPADDRVALLLGRALSYQHRFAEAEAALDDRWPNDLRLLTEIVSIRAQNLGFGLGRVTQARDLFARAAKAVDNPDLRARLNNERATISAIHGDFADTMSATQAVLSDPNTSAAPRASAHVALSVAHAMTGDGMGFHAVHDEAMRYADLAREVLPFAHDQIEIMHTAALINAGRFEEAVSLTGSAVEKAGRGGALVPTWLSARCMALVVMGRLRTAKSTAQRAHDLFSQADPFGLELQAAGIAAFAAGQMGDTGPGTLLDKIEVLPAAPRLSIWIDLGRAWTEAARGRPAQGARIAAESGRRAVECEHYAWAMLCLYNASRLGAPEHVVQDAGQIDVSRDVDLLATMRAHIEAFATGDAGGVADAAKRFAAMGAHLPSAECFAQAASILEGRGASAAAARCVVLSRVAELRCEDPHTPALADRPPLVTGREVQIAFDAATGLSSREIAARRYISVRTVDNHLRSVYRKLDVAGRDELASLLPGIPDTADRVLAPRVDS